VAAPDGFAAPSAGTRLEVLAPLSALYDAFGAAEEVKLRLGS
jgi:hypothetical protein